MLFQDGKFQWGRLENLIELAKEGGGSVDLSSTVADGAKVRGRVCLVCFTPCRKAQLPWQLLAAPNDSPN